MNSLRFHQLLFALILLFTATYATLSELSVLPSGFLGGNGQWQYVLDVLCVVLCIGGTYTALRLMSFAKTRRELALHGASAYFKWDALRLAILAISLFTEVFVYYATLQSQTAHYALMISLIAAVFCFPSQREVVSLTRKDS